MRILLFFHSFHIIDHLIFFIFVQFWPCRLEVAVLVQIPNLRFTQELIHSLRMCMRTSLCRASRPHLRIILFGTNVLPHTLRFLTAFANANFHDDDDDDDVLIFANAAVSEVSKSIHNWAYTEEFYMAKDWFGMNDIDLQSPTSPSDLVIPLTSPFLFLFFLQVF